MITTKKSKYFGILFIILIFSSLIFIFSGPVNIFTVDKEMLKTIIFKVRLPRLILGIIVGAGLAASGTIFQGLLHNPLADPFILGTSAGATFGITIGMLCGCNSIFMPLIGVISAFLTTLFIYGLAKRQGEVNIGNLLLTGLIVTTFFSAATVLLISLFKKETYEVMFYLMGSLSRTDFNLILISGIYVLIGIIISMVYLRDLNILSCGDEVAYHLGINVSKVRKILFFTASFLVGGVVSISGMIGFVGIIVVHISRLIFGPDHRILLPASILGGSIFLILCDTLARTIAVPLELPVGVITAFCGGPFFVYLLKRKC